MNPKIADFGMARIFKHDKTQAITNRVVRTYGYMSSVYAMEGTFLVKSDVFSFGILILENLLLGNPYPSIHGNHGWYG
ncbi:unnamed protein product [Coffea canephora]|uniref:Protein kinase domain-containing protein n=1 Tax=Coffea canephora TaxID=49390 RepID=A0A068UXN4_COFCA|nr:unnamed protein product [Coffea canephora]